MTNVQMRGIMPARVSSKLPGVCGIIALLLFGTAEEAEAVKASQLVYGETGRLDTFDPYTVHEASGQRLADLLFDGLLRLDPGGEYRPALAESWAINKAGTEVVFTLRRGVMWHADEGRSRPFTSKDVVTTIKLLTNSSSEIPNRERFRVIKSAAEVSSTKVKVTMRRALVDPLRVLMFKILPDHKLGATPSLKRGSAFSKRPVGTGPYYFVKANSQGEILLAANTHYFGGVPKIKRIVMKSYADQSIMAQSLMFSSLDLVTYVSPRDLGEVVGDAKLSIVPYDALSFSFFAMNNSRGVLRDKRVRQAISHAVNRKEMLDAFFQGKGRLISGPFPPTSWAYNLDVKPYPFDVKRAKSLLAAAGLRDRTGDGSVESAGGSSVRLVFAVPLAGESEMIKRIVLAFQGYLQSVGVAVELQFMDWLVWKKKVLKERDYDITIASWSFDDASNITSLFHSSSAVPWGNNFVNYRNVEVDSLLTEADATNDFDKRRAIYHKLHAIIADEAPYTFLWTLMHHAAHKSQLTGVRVEPFAFFKHITAWEIQTTR